MFLAELTMDSVQNRMDQIYGEKRIKDTPADASYLILGRNNNNKRSSGNIKNS